MKSNLTIAILFGGRSAEHEVSLRSAQAVHRHLDRGKYRVTSIFINKLGKWRPVDSPNLSERELNDGRFYSFLPWESLFSAAFSADVYFPILHGPYGEDGTIQGLFELADVPYVGAAAMPSAVGMDKSAAKIMFQAAGLDVADFQVLREKQWKADLENIAVEIAGRFGFPFFVKPANMGSSVGISKIKHSEDIRPGITEAFLYDDKILIEQAIQGREVECSVLGNENPRASLPGEVIPFREFYDYRDKYIEGKTSFRMPADLSDEVTEEIRRQAVAAFRAIDCSGMARVDFFYQENPGRIVLNEINTIPGFTDISMYPKLWEVSGLAFPALLDELIDLARQRHRKKKRHLPEDIP